jgi:hypothetical protein
MIMLQIEQPSNNDIFPVDPGQLLFRGNAKFFPEQG